MGTLTLTAFALVLLGLGGLSLIRTRFTFALTLVLFPLAAGLLVFVTTEALSAFGLITPAAMWIVVTSAGLVMLLSWRRIKIGLTSLRADANRQLTSVQNDYLGLRLSQRWWIWPALAITAGTLLVTLFLALWGPPNNADSLGYHLPRVMQWLQNASVDHYATHDLRQVSIAPLAGYGLLWLSALSGSDLLLNLNQWLAYAWMTFVGGLVASRMAGSRIAGLLALFLVAATPMAIAEATTTQSDLIGALWVVVAIGLVIERRMRHVSFGVYSAGLFVASGLAAATKTTALVSMAVVIVGAMIAEIAPSRGRKFEPRFRASAGFAMRVGLAAMFGAVVGLIPQAIRNQVTFGSISGETFGLLTERQDLTVLAGNSLRIVLRNVGVPTVLGDHANMRLEEFFDFLRIPWIDPAAVGYGHLPFISLARNEDYATSPIQLVVGLIAAILILALRRSSTELRLLAGMGVGMLLTTALVWKWNEWGNRFLIQIMFALTVSLAVLLWHLVWSLRRGVLALRLFVGLLVVAASLYGLLVSLTIQYRPILDSNSVLTMPRELRYFYVRGQQQALDVERLRAQIDCIRAGDSVGIPDKVGVDEYFLWVFLNPDREFRLQAVGVENATSKYEEGDVDWTLGVDQCGNAVGG